jgi:chemotaxis protein methyltransferase CheR
MRRALPDELLSRLSAWVAAQTGLYFPQERWRDLEGGVAAAARDFGLPDAESCARWLLSTVPARNQVEILASHLTVGETYFFREPRGLEVFEQQILPELLRSRHDGGRHLRIWSAACCTGEEPYSIAMILDRVIPDPGTCPVTLLATDINPQFLRKAAEGVYGEWSFRDTPGWARERYFRKKGSARFELLPKIRNRVTFSYLNLADDVYPSLLTNTNAMDVIFCRNVLMYFTAARAQEVVRNLYRSLVDGGWLIVSPAETSGTLFASFSAVQFPGVLVYRKVAGVPPGVVVERGLPPAFLPAADAMELLVPSGTGDVAQGNWRAGPQDEVPLGVPETPEDSVTPAHGTGDGPAFAGAARNCANEGRLAEAVEWCDKAIAADKLNPAHYYLLGAIQQEQGHGEAAQRSLKRALYLDPGFVLAHFALGNGELLQGRPREAERHFRNALAMLQRHPQDEVVPEAEGLTAEGLTGIVMSVLSSLPRASVMRA